MQNHVNNMPLMLIGLFMFLIKLLNLYYCWSMAQNTGDLSVREQYEDDNDQVFDGTKLGLFVSRKKFDSEDSSVEKRPVNSSQEMFKTRERTLGMPGAWQEPIEEEAEEEPELSKLRSSEGRKIAQLDKSGPNKPSKLKLNFSIWEKRDSFASKRAVKRIFMNRTNFPCNTETHSSNHIANTTVDTSEKPPSDNSKQLPHRRKLSLMTELSNSGGKLFLSQTCD